MTTTQTYAALDRLIRYKPVIIGTADGLAIASKRHPGEFHQVTPRGCDCGTEFGTPDPRRDCCHFVGFVAITRGILDVSTWTYNRPGATTPAAPHSTVTEHQETPHTPVHAITARQERKLTLIASRAA